jgi:hypothetical protein
MGDMFPDSVRWPWALLQAALDGGDNTLSLESIVLALSGEKLISPEVKKDKKYCTCL